MVKCMSLLILSLALFPGCAANSKTGASPSDYVEIDNPAFTMSPGAEPTIWVPRADVDSGIPRGGELLEKGYDTVRDNMETNVSRSSVHSQGPAAPPVVTRRQVPPVVKNRMMVIDVDKNGLGAGFADALKKVSAGNVVDPTKTAFVARYAAVGTPSERASLARKLQEDFGVNLVLYLSAPRDVSSGSPVTVDVYESFGGSLVKKLEAPVLPGTGTSSAVFGSALRKLALEVRDTAALSPWYGRVVTVESSRVYIDAGKESGLSLGRILNLYRPGKVVGKLGYAPGRKIGILEVTGFVGTDGAFGIVKEGDAPKVSDLVGTE